jgi:hypothetical protein
MYGSLNTDKYDDGQHLWYETCFGNGKFILIVDKQSDYNVRSFYSKSKNSTSSFMKKCIDKTEVFPITEESHPEKYIIEGARV